MAKREFKRKYWYPISVSIEIRLRKIRKAIDRFYKKICIPVFIVWVLGMASLPFICHYLEQRNQIDRILDEPFSDRFQHWNTEGSPGQEPPTDREQKILEFFNSLHNR